MKKDELIAGFADILHSIRIQKGLSKNAMAEYLGINKRTWYAWESGRSSPNIVEFIRIFTECGIPMLRPILQMLYPDTYADHSDIDSIRNETIEFFRNDASDHMVRVWNFLYKGSHGSNVAPQVEEFCALDHLPMEYRYYIAEMIYVFYKTADRRGELIATDEVMPNMSVWENGLKKGQAAAFRKLQSYTTITEEN